jgi:hypothetical protein
VTGVAISPLAFPEVRPIGLRRAWRWVKRLFGLGTLPQTA